MKTSSNYMAVIYTLPVSQLKTNYTRQIVAIYDTKDY